MAYKKGHLSCWKGLTKENSERVRKRSEKIEKRIRNKDYFLLTLEKAYVFGTLCGDGWMSKHQIGLDVTDKDFAEFFSKCLQKVYGLNCSIKRKKKVGGYKKNGKEFIEIVLCSKKAKEDLLEYDITKKGFKTSTWRVPVEIKSAKKNVKSMFIRGFFDSEGGVYGRTIQSVSSNKKGLLDVLELLISLNIKSKLYEQKREGRNLYRIEICSRPNQAKYFRLIGFSIKRKQDRLINLLKNSSRFNKFTPKQYYEVQELHKQGLGKVKISRQMNINVGTISDWIYRKKKIMPLCIRNEDLKLDINCIN